MTIDDLRRFAVARNFSKPATLKRALARLGFVQADPIRAPARAQDLTLRHRVAGYQAGDLERRYESLDLEEDFFVNHGFLSRAVRDLMHPRPVPKTWTGVTRTQAQAVLDFVRERAAVTLREVNGHFAFGSVTNYWGGSSNATTHLLEAMHYRGLLRVVRRDAGIRVYGVSAPAPEPRDRADRLARIDALLDVAVRQYAPLPSATLAWLVNRLQVSVPQWRKELPATLTRAKARLRCERVDRIDWYWPADERLPRAEPQHTARLLTPFDPLVWDRRRFERLWGWKYRFEAYTPVARRQFGYYALPLLWRDHIVGWANAEVKDGTLRTQLGYARSAPRDRAFARELEAEVDRLRVFLRL